VFVARYNQIAAQASSSPYPWELRLEHTMINTISAKGNIEELLKAYA
jgi:hypothetical protein